MLITYANTFLQNYTQPLDILLHISIIEIVHSMHSNPDLIFVWPYIMSETNACLNFLDIIIFAIQRHSLRELQSGYEVFVLYPQLNSIWFVMLQCITFYFWMYDTVWYEETRTTQMVPIHFTPNNIRLLSSGRKYVWLTAHCKSLPLLHTTGYHLIYCFLSVCHPMHFSMGA